MPRLSGLEHVWEPLTIGAFTAKHRIMHTASTLLYSQDNVISDRHIAYWRERAKGGAALIITEQQVAHRHGRGAFAQDAMAWDKRAIPQYEKLARAVHTFGCKQVVQLFGVGMQGTGTLGIDEWHPMMAPSRVPSALINEIPLVMEQEHIDNVAEDFAQSALNVKIAGLDGVEISGAHNWLIGQFLSPAYNKRTDKYGGSVRNRCRFLLEVGEKIRECVDGDLTVGIRLDFDDFIGPAGILPEEAEEQLDIFAESGLFDFFNITGGGHDALHMTVPSMNVDRGFMTPFGKRAKDVVGDRGAVFIVGRILDVEMADQIVADGAADMVGMTRAQIADPFLVQKAQQDREGEMIRCFGSQECISRAFSGTEVVCTANPATGREQYWGSGNLSPVPDGGKEILVVGGGPSGMKFAETAARRGHRVRLLERTGELGGNLNLLKRLPTRGDWQIGIDNLVRGMQTAGVDVQLDTDGTCALVQRAAPDAVVCATGSSFDRDGFSMFRPERIAMPGADKDHVLDVASATETALKDPSALGDRVVIVDQISTYLPLGLADVLASAGVDVEVVSPEMFIGAQLIKTLDMPHLVPRLKSMGVRLTAQHFVERINDREIELYDMWGGGSYSINEVDSVILAMLRSPEDGLYQELRSDGVNEVHRIGDAVAPRMPVAVIYEGEELGRKI